MTEARAPLRCEVCAADAVVRVRRELGAEVWRCARCGDAKHWCPRCDQGWVRRARHPALDGDFRSCDECEASWPLGTPLEPPGTDLQSFLERRGVIHGVAAVQTVREAEGVPPAR